jgi:hypothetical protein
MHTYTLTHEADRRMADRHADAAAHRRVRTSIPTRRRFRDLVSPIAGLRSRQGQLPAPRPQSSTVAVSRG